MIKQGERVSHQKYGAGRVTMQEHTATNGKQRAAVLTDRDNRTHMLDVNLLTRLDAKPDA